MIWSYRSLVVGGLFSCCLMTPEVLSAASGCGTAQLLGVYSAEVTSIGFQTVLQPVPTLPPTTTSGPAVVVVGFGSNPNSLSGSLPGLGRYYFDGTGNVVGLSSATSTSPAVNANVGSYSVNTDCSATVKLSTGAAYDLFLAGGGKEARYVRTDSTGGGELGVLRRSGSCVNLSYPGSFAFQIGGGSKQTDSFGGSALYPYSAVGTLNLNGSGLFTMSESLVTATGVQRSTPSGSYTVGADCSVTLSFATTTGFVSPTSFRFLMVDATTGLLSLQPDTTGTTFSGSLIAQ